MKKGFRWLIITLIHLKIAMMNGRRRMDIRLVLDRSQWKHSALDV